jgi:hypothetical protein
MTKKNTMMIRRKIIAQQFKETQEQGDQEDTKSMVTRKNIENIVTKRNTKNMTINRNTRTSIRAQQPRRTPKAW